MICSKCGAQIPDDAKFCGTCGNNVATQSEAPVQTQPETTNTEALAVENEASSSEEKVSIVEEAAPVVEEASQNPEYTTYNPTTEPTQQYQYTPNPEQAPQFNTPGQPPIPPANNYQQMDAEASKRGLIILAGIAVAAIIVIVLLFNLIFGGGWKSVIKDRVKCYNKQTTDVKDYYIATYGEICGEFNYEQAKLIAKLTDEDDWEEDAEEEIEETYEYFEKSFGDDWEIDYEIKSNKALSDSKIDDAQDSWESAVESLENILDTLEDIDDPKDYNDELDEDDLEDLIKFYEKWHKKLEKMEVKKGYKVKYNMIIEGEDGDSKEKVTTNIVKIDGEWMTDNFYFEYPELLW